MYPAPTDRLRRAYAAFSAGGEIDWSLFHPSVRHDHSEGLFLDGVFFGEEGIRAAVEEVHADWEDIRYDLVDVVEQGDLVLVLLRMRARVRDTQAELDAQVAHVWEFRDGQAVRCDAYGDHASALRALSAGSPRALH
jgi:ketosteroid isomerase-like protein